MNIDNFEILAKRLKQIRTEKGMTQKDFAQEMGVTPVTLSAYENNLKRPSLDLILKVAKKYEISLDWLCGLSNKQSEQNNQEYKTYSDILKTLIEWDKILKISIEIIGQEEDTPFSSHRMGIILENKIFQDSIEDWYKFRKLLNEGSIDKKIYIACIEKMLRDTKCSISKNEEVFDDDLPF